MISWKIQLMTPFVVRCSLSLQQNITDCTVSLQYKMHKVGYSLRVKAKALGQQSAMDIGPLQGHTLYLRATCVYSQCTGMGRSFR